MEYTKGKWVANLSGTLSKVKTEDGVLIGWGLGCEKHYSEDLRDVKNESWLSFRKRTEPLRKREEQETEANAKLISAAPDLLRELEDCVMMLEGLHVQESALESAKKAIEKALK